MTTKQRTRSKEGVALVKKITSLSQVFGLTSIFEDDNTLRIKFFRYRPLSTEELTLIYTLVNVYDNYSIEISKTENEVVYVKIIISNWY